MRHYRPGRLAGTLWVVLLLLTSCTRTSPYLEPIEAQTPMEFSLWRAKIGAALTADEWRWFERVVQEHKYAIMQAGKASGSEAIDEAARSILHGRPLAEVMREGLQVLIRRETAELDERIAAFQLNERRAHIIPRDDEQKLRDFALHQEELQRKIARSQDDLAQLRAALAAFEAKVGR